MFEANVYKAIRGQTCWPHLPRHLAEHTKHLPERCRNIFKRIIPQLTGQVLTLFFNVRAALLNGTIVSLYRLICLLCYWKHGSSCWVGLCNTVLKRRVLRGRFTATRPGEFTWRCRDLERDEGSAEKWVHVSFSGGRTLRLPRCFIAAGSSSVWNAFYMLQWPFFCG